MQLTSSTLIAFLALAWSTPSVAYRGSEFSFFQQTIDGWRVEAVTQLSREDTPKIIDVRCKAESRSLSLRLMRSGPLVVDFSHHYVDQNDERLEVPETELRSIDMDGRHLKARYLLTAYQKYKFSNVRYPLEDEGAITFGGGHLELQESGGPWLDSSAYVSAILASHTIVMYFRDQKFPRVEASTLGLRHALGVCSEKMASREALVLPPERMTSQPPE